MDKNAEGDARTVFVRGLPFTYTDSQLEEIFSEIGPVRRAFTVKTKGSEKHRGLGFVQFAVAEDAQQAISAKNATTLDNRKIHVELAKRRASFSERIKKRRVGDKNAEGQEGAASDDIPQAGKRPHPEENAESQAKKKQKKSEVSEATKLKEDGPDAGVQQKKENAASGKNKKPKKGKVVLEPNAPSQTQRVARTVVIGSLTSPQTTETVMALAKKLGTVESIQNQLSQADINSHDLARDGCKLPAASIVFNSVRAAREAVQSFHQQRIGDIDIWARQMGGEGSKPKKWRLIVRNLPFKVTEKELKEKFSAAGFVWEVTVPRKENNQSKGFGFVGYTSKADAEKAIQTLNGTKIFNRPVAVDWTVAKSKFETIAKKSADNSEKDDETASESEGEENEDVSRKTLHISDDEPKEKELEEEEEEDGDAHPETLKSSDDMDLVKRVLDKLVTQEVEEVKGGGHVAKDESKTDEPKTDDTETKVDDTMERTLFVRNLPIDAEVWDLKERFSKFGVVKALRLVRHSLTKKPKGTAFLEFETSEAAKLAVKAAEGADAGKSSLVIGGKHVILHFAVDKDSARDISKQKSIEQEDSDRRNLHLVTEGLIKQGTPSAQGVSEADLAKRKALQVEKATKLRSPIFHVSQTRLAFHNFPKTLTETEVKRMFIEAVRSRATKQTPRVKQVKLLKGDNEVSRGSGFVEFSEHQHALVALRVLNNNPETFTAKKRPIVEFAIENIQKLRQRENRMNAMKKMEQKDGQKKLGNEQDKQGGEKKFNKQDKQGGGKKFNKQRDSSQEVQNAEQKNDEPRKGKKRNRDAEDKQNLGNADQNKKSNKQKKRKGGNDIDNKQNADQQHLDKENPKGDAQMDTENVQEKRMKKQKGDKPKGRRGQRGKQIEDKLDKLVSEYRSKYFSDRVAVEAAPKKALDNIKRWFE